MSTSELPMKLTETQYSYLTLVRNHRKCKSIESEMGDEVGTNDYESRALSTKSARMFFNGLKPSMKWCAVCGPLYRNRWMWPTVSFCRLQNMWQLNTINKTVFQLQHRSMVWMFKWTARSRNSAISRTIRYCNQISANPRQQLMISNGNLSNHETMIEVRLICFRRNEIVRVPDIRRSIFLFEMLITIRITR